MIHQTRPTMRLHVLLLLPLAWVSVAWSQVDGDADGVPFDRDECPYSRPGEFVDARGCTTLQDSDEDGISDIFDDCPLTPMGAVIDPRGCAQDADGDGVPDGIDQCAGTPISQVPASDGCSPAQRLARRQGVEARVDVGRPSVVRAQVPPMAGGAGPGQASPQADAQGTSGREPVLLQQVAEPTPPTVAPHPAPAPAADYAPSGRDLVIASFVLNSPRQAPPAQSRPITRVPPARTSPPASNALPAAVPTPVAPPPPVQAAPLQRVPQARPEVAAVQVLAPRREPDPRADSPVARAVARALLGVEPGN